MSSRSLEELPENLRSVRTAPLFVMRLVVPKVISVGATPGAFRRLGVVSGGTFEGERLSGEVLNGGNDWQDVRADGATTLDVRLVLKTNDGALIAMSYRGVRHGPADVLARIDRGEAADPQSYYFRIARCLRRRRRDTPGSTASSRSASASAFRTAWSTASSRSFRRKAALRHSANGCYLRILFSNGSRAGDSSGCRRTGDACVLSALVRRLMG
jgi:Protein of unknown function (DUF3237)